MSIRAMLCLAGLAGVVSASGAAVLTATGTINLYGTSYPVSQWRTLGDAGTSAFDAEALTFYQGVLYASADEGASAGNGRLVYYTPGPTGNLSSPSFYTTGTNGAFRWGGEGLTVNTSGSGYGSFGPGGFKLVSVDSRGDNANGAVINVDDPGPVKSLSDIIPLPETDDVAWVGSRNQFALLLDADGSIGWYDNAMNATGLSVPTFTEAKGLTVVSAGWAQRVFGFSSMTSEVLMVVGKETNRLQFFDTNGVPLAPITALSPVGLNFAEIEGVAVDEANDLIYLADEAAISIHVIQVPGPGAGVVLALAGLTTLRRRRD
ncbi:MAG: hypothetical protein JNK25_01085 [Phycisphaerae bacterium]|nr:hypothetical protein [Phycisphaerae bacterium]